MPTQMQLDLQSVGHCRGDHQVNIHTGQAQAFLYTQLGASQNVLLESGSCAGCVRAT